MRQNNANRIITSYFSNYLDYHKGDKITINKEQEIFSCNTLIGKLCYDYESMSDTYLLLTLEDFKSQPSWKTHKRQLAEAANNAGIIVIFTDYLDIGFGLNINITPNDIINNLLKVAKYSQDNDIKTSCYISPEDEDILGLYSYNQLVNNEMLHAEDAVLKVIGSMKTHGIISLLEPCYNCLSEILSHDIRYISYYISHKAKWNTDDYLELRDKLQNKYIRHSNGQPILYSKINNSKVIAFYNKSKRRI